MSEQTSLFDLAGFRGAEAPEPRPLPLEPPPRVIHSVSDLVRKAQQMLEARFAEVWVEGEVSSFKPHPSGHQYFSLKDPSSQIPCVIWRSTAARFRFRLKDGLKILCRGKLSLYESHGKFQMYVEAVEPVGQGALFLAFEELKAKLSREGLFASERKRSLPRAPRCVGLVTSPSGAAVRDIIRVLHRRFPARIVLAPALVQGPEAPGQIVRAIGRIQELSELEVLIVGRGGGSMEDLWAFNDEAVARAIASCRVPVISAVGHEVDFTIADFVADVRAPTPSAAAEMVVPVADELRAEMLLCASRMSRAMARDLVRRRERLERTREQLEAKVRRVFGDRAQALDELSTRLHRDHPMVRLHKSRHELLALRGRLEALACSALAERRRQFETRIGRLEALSPLRVLDRGYALARTANGHVITRATDVTLGSRISLRLSNAQLECEVKDIIKHDS